MVATNQMGLALLAVLTLIGLLTWAIKKFPSVIGLKGFESGLIKVLSALSLGGREKILLIEVDGKKILIGVTSQNITCLLALGAAAQNSSLLKDPVN